MNNNFIDHNNPTARIDMDAGGIEFQYSTLSEQEKITIGAKLLGMNHVPVSFEQFICDDYFLGNPGITNGGRAIFDIWKKAGNEIYPTPISTKTPYVSFGGCIGSGKSTMSKLMGLYTYHRLDCCTNALSSLGLAGGVKLAFAFFHANEQTAFKDFVQYFRKIFEISPYFKNLYNNPDIRLISSGPQSVGGIIGVQMVYGCLSELGFWRPQDAVNKVGETLIRYQSRFMAKRFNFGGVIADSSAKDADHSACDRFEESVPAEELYVAKFSHWVARPELYRESMGKTFDFYRGDSVKTPHIIADNEDRGDLDPDRIIQCPVQTKKNFEMSPIRSLQDLAGFGYTTKDLFFNGSVEGIVKCSTIRNQGDDIISDLDFYNLGDTIYDRVAPMIMQIPKGIQIFLHLDIGLRSDNLGMAICYYDGEVEDDDIYNKTHYPKFCFPLIVGISRKKGQSTSLDHVFQFIQRLSQEFLVFVSADGFASAGLFQSCERIGIEHELVSVDKTTEPYIMMKNVVNSGRARMVYNRTFLRECSELQMVSYGTTGKMKVDHPEESNSFEFDYEGRTGSAKGSKDIADAVTGSLWSCYKKYSQWLEEGSGGVNKQLEIITKMVDDSKNSAQEILQGMLESVYDY